mgnify:FL=1
MTDHANELRRHARKIPHPQGETPGVMLRAADEIERLATKLKAAEKERDFAKTEIARLHDDIRELTDERVLDEEDRERIVALRQGTATKPAPSVPDGWKEAAIAWEVCASIHREYGKGKDPFFNTRQGDFVKHANDARAMLAAAPEAKS